MDNMKQLIYNLRYGHSNIKDLTDAELETLLDYYLPEDVRALCFLDIYNRRELRLSKAKE